MPEMKATMPTAIIHDVAIKPLQAEGGLIQVLRYSDHWLPRVGLIQYLTLAAGERTPLRLRPTADEVWVLLQGSCTFHWHDLRPHSPSFENSLDHSVQSPTLALAPFGVSFGVEAAAQCRLLRLAAFEEDSDHEVQHLPWADYE
jgi:hypothetical protein